MKKLLLAVLFLLIGSGLAGCDQNEPPPFVIEEDAYIDLMVELHLLRSYVEIVPADSATVDSLRREIYSKYDITAEQFIKSHEFYQSRYTEQKERIDKAIERLRMDQVESDSTRPWERNR